MAPSLKERYGQRQLQQLQERARVAHVQVLAEQKAAQLLVEAMKEDDLQKVSAIVQKLDTIKSPELPTLTAAIEQAQAELNKYTGGGPITAAWTKLKGLVGIDNPVVKITTFADALERGFSQIPTILKNNGVNLEKADLSKSLSTILAAPAPTGAKSDKEMGKSPVTGKDVPDNEKVNVPKSPTGAKSDQELAGTSFGGGKGKADNDYSVPGPESKPGTPPTGAREPPATKHTGGQEPPPKLSPTGAKKPQKPLPAKKSSAADEGHDLTEADPTDSPFVTSDSGRNKPAMGDQKLKNITAQIRKAMSPGGIFGAFKKVPYINGDALAQELVQAPIKVFANVAKRVQQGAKAAEIAPDMKGQIQGQGDQQTKGANTAQPSQQSAQSQPGQPSKPTVATTDTTGTGEAPKTGPGQARGGGAEVQGGERGQGATPEKAQQFRAGLAKIYKGAGVDPDVGQKMLKYLISNKLMDRSAVEGHGNETPDEKPAA